jgi:hypothetical protein
LQHFIITFCCIIFFGLITGSVAAQLTISGTVYDSSRTIPVKNVTVKSSGGMMTVTDSSGHYDIGANDKDSLTFIYNNKPTARFAIKNIENIGSFDISLHIRLPEKFRTLKEVRVFTRSFKEDSIANREEYAKIFNYQRPGISTSVSDYSGGGGLDLDEFINIFRFKRNKRLKFMQNRLLEQEQETYINYRFNKTLVKRITHLVGKDLDTFMVRYRPDYDFTQRTTTAVFYQYILNASYQFKKELLTGEAKKETP